MSEYVNIYVEEGEDGKIDENGRCKFWVSNIYIYIYIWVLHVIGSVSDITNRVRVSGLVES